MGVALLVGAFLNAVALNETPLGPEGVKLRVFLVGVNDRCIYVYIQDNKIKFDNFEAEGMLCMHFSRYQNVICKKPINLRSNMTNDEVIKSLKASFNDTDVRCLLQGMYPEPIWHYKSEKSTAEKGASQRFLEPSKSEKSIAEKKEALQSPRWKQVWDLMKRGCNIECLLPGRYLEPSESEKSIAENESSQRLLKPSEKRKINRRKGGGFATFSRASL